MHTFLRSALLAVIAFSMLSAQADLAPLELDEKNPHYFRYHGRTIVLVTSGEHYGAIINADFDQTKYLDTLQRDGLNYTRIFGGSYIEVPGESFGIRRNTLAPLPGRLILPWARSNEVGYTGGGNRLDLGRWNADYFRRLHRFLTAAEQRGIIVEVTLFSSQYSTAQWKISAFNTNNNVNHTDAIDWRKINTLANGNLLAYQERYVRKLVREVNSFPNVIFEIQNEPWADRGVFVDVINPYLAAPNRDRFPNSVDLADDASLAWQLRVAEWIKMEEATLPNKHLIAQNCCNFRFPVERTLAGVSIVNFHYAYPEAIALNYGLNKAIAYDESGFLGQNDDAYRREAWNFMLAGGSSYDGLDYSFTPGHEDGSDLGPNGPGGGSPALRKQLGILHRFLNDLPLSDMRPDQTTVVHAGKVRVHMLSDRRASYAAYLDGAGPAQIVLRLPPGAYRGVWLNPIDGTTIPIQEFKSDGGERILDTPLFRTGNVLRLTAAPAAKP